MLGKQDASSMELQVSLHCDLSIETSPETHNDHVLAILLCKYAYYVRNKCFHGQQADLSFCFSDKTNDDDIIDMLNELLLRITTELFISYSSL